MNLRTTDKKAVLVAVLGVGLTTLAAEPAPQGPDQPQPTPAAVAAAEESEPVSPWERWVFQWNGLRPALADKGVVFELLWSADFSRNLRGGADTANWASRNLLNLNLSIETEPLLGWKGGTFFVNFQNFGGDNGSDLTGDLQAFSNTDAPYAVTQISELWFEQYLMGEHLRLKIGKVDANAEFAFPEQGAEFLHSGMSFPSTNIYMPTYPESATSVNLFFYPNDTFYVGAGMYDGALAEGIRTGPRGPATFWGDPGDLYLIGEAGVKWKIGPRQLAGRLAAGGWHHTGTFDRFNGGTENGTSGWHVLLDQQLWRENPDKEDDAQGIGAFVLFDVADGAVMDFDRHLSFGVAWTGAIPTRDEDIMGIGLSSAHFTNAAGADYSGWAETAIEAFYKFQVTSFLSLKADLQYITNPGGADLDDALVATLRVEVTY